MMSDIVSCNPFHCNGHHSYTVDFFKVINKERILLTDLKFRKVITIVKLAHVTKMLQFNN